MNNLVTFCAVFLVAGCQLAKAYDFQDAEFNQVLSSELEDLLDSADNVPLPARARRRRDEESAAATEEKCRKRHRKQKLCCAEETIDALHDKEKELTRACFKQVTGVEKPEKHERGGHHKKFDLFSCEEVEKRKSDMICIHECASQKKGLLAEDGSPDPDKITSYLKESYAKESWFESAVDKIVTNCLAEAKNATENPVKFYSSKDLKVCNPSGLTLNHCVFKEIQLSCPADQIKDKAACERFQERIKKGIEFYGPPPAPFDGAKDE